MTDDRRPDEGFAARARIGGRRATRTPLVATGIVVAFLAVAIVKPWVRPIAPKPSAAPPSTGPIASPVASTQPVPSDLPIVVVPHSNDSLVAIADDHADWGMRAIVQSRRGILAGPLLRERWAAATVPSGLDPIPGPADDVQVEEPLGDPSDVAFAIGVTTPLDALPLDVRFWRTSEDRGWARLTPVPIPGPEPGSWLWRPDPTWATTDGTWPSGTYRADVLLGPRIVRLDVVLPGTYLAAGTMLIDNPFVPPIEARLTDIVPGPVAVSDYGVEPIDLAGGGGFDERTAWLAPYLGDGYVAQAYGTSMTALGVVAPSGRGPASLILEQVSGISTPSAVAVDLTAVDSTDGSKTALLAWPLGGHLIQDGLWRLTAGWADGRTQSWLVEVLPRGAEPVPASPLEALSRWAAAAHGESSTGPVIVVPAADGDPTVNGACQPGTRIRSSDPLLGVELPVGVRLTGVQVLVSDASRAPDWTIRFTGDPVDRMAVVALPDGGLPAREYDLLLRLAQGSRHWSDLQRICVSD